MLFFAREIRGSDGKAIDQHHSYIISYYIKINEHNQTLVDQEKVLYGAKAGLEHRNYPYDLKRLKFTTLDMIPSSIPSVPIGNNRT